jgi:periplasmic protein TonB
MIAVVMVVPGPSGMAGRAARRPVVSAIASIAVHGGLLWLIFLLAGVHAMPARTVIELTTIQVVEPPPPPPPPPPATGQGTRFQSTAKADAGMLGRRGHSAPARSQTHAPAVANPFADLAVSYETPTAPDPGNVAGTTGPGLGAGLFGDGTGTGGGGYGTLTVPPPPGPSLARPPRPKLDYHSWDFRASRRFAGQAVLVELTIDPAGHVRHVSVLKSVDPAVDHHAMDLASRFEFHPALDSAGTPTSGRHRWEFVIVGDNDLGFHFQPRM